MSEPNALTKASERLSLLVDRAVSSVCALIFGAMTITVLLGVFTRYVLNAPLSWTEETARYLMIWGASLAISIGVRENEHVGLSILYDAIKSVKARKALTTIVFVLVAAFLVFMTILGVGMTVEASTRMTMALGITMFIPTLAVPIAMVLALVQLVFAYLVAINRDMGREKAFTVIDI